MPKKKTSKGKKGKKGKKKSGKKSAEESPVPVEPMAPAYVPPPPKPGENVSSYLFFFILIKPVIYNVKLSFCFN